MFDEKNNKFVSFDVNKMRLIEFQWAEASDLNEKLPTLPANNLISSQRFKITFAFKLSKMTK